LDLKKEESESERLMKKGRWLWSGPLKGLIWDWQQTRTEIGKDQRVGSKIARYGNNNETRSN
jgi:hypothetical protein